MTSGEFYEDDEPVEDVVTTAWWCEHMTVSGSMMNKPDCGCGCDMRPAGQTMACR